MADGGEVSVAVIGGGPAGIAAAVRAAESGADVLLIDDAPGPGGQIWKHSGPHPAGRSARRWLGRLAGSGARILSSAQVVLAQWNGAATLTVETVSAPGRRLRVSARSLVLATGARERFLPFPGWTLPGVVGVGAAQLLLKSGASFRGRRAIVAGSGPLLLAAAAALARAGARVELVAEQASAHDVGRFAAGLLGHPLKLLQAGAYRSRILFRPYRTGCWVTAAHGGDRVREAVLTDGLRTWTRPCDLLCSGFGLLPNLELPRMLGCEIADDRVAVDGAQRTSVPGIYCAGELTGIGGAELALLAGEVAGLAAAGRPGSVRRLAGRRRRLLEFARALETAFALRRELRALPSPDTVVCRCEDVALGRLDPAWSRRQAKLYTRLGMGPCQGRICGAAVEFLFGWEPDSVRPPLRPAALGCFVPDSDEKKGGTDD